MTPPLQTLQNHLARALEQGLPLELAQQSASLALEHPVAPGTLGHDLTDFVQVYAQARRLREGFEAQLRALETLCGGHSSLRPGGIKSLERSLTKAEQRGTVPTDLLAGKVVMGSMRGVYACADLLEGQFKVVGFLDRFVAPMRSGYRDLQFGVALEDEHHGQVFAHIVEVKIVHQDFDVLDRHEHRIYEINRELAGESGSFGRIETMFLDELRTLSQTVYSKLWAHIRTSELASESASELSEDTPS